MPAEVFTNATAYMREEAGRGLPRWVDVVVAFLCLVIATPVLLLCGLAVLLSSGLPILFRQTRVGQNGKKFELYKLRTMRPSGTGPQVTSANDTRITTVGKFLRFSKLDELPTFWNVLRGDMSLVGPRPEVPRYVDPENPLWSKVLSVRPGLTDPVTLSLRNEATLLATVEGDAEEFYLQKLQPKKLLGYVEYLDHRSSSNDARVLFLTLLAIIQPARRIDFPIIDSQK